LLYVIHGTLHLAGYRDKTEAERAAIRRAEVQALRGCGVELPSAKQTARKGA
jgi:ssRNA-specific RNase YbeY (16S rRNA maturation enzyme)